jgi:hypothetical protein
MSPEYDNSARSNVIWTSDGKEKACCEDVQVLSHESAFVRSWTIVSLCIIGRTYPEECGTVVDWIAPLERDKSTAIRTRARKAIGVLTNVGAVFPRGWIKSESFKDLER